jgi:hypothetical protein
LYGILFQCRQRVSRIRSFAGGVLVEHSPARPPFSTALRRNHLRRLEGKPSGAAQALLRWPAGMCGPPSLCRVLTPAAASCAGSRLCLRRLSFCDVSDADEACCEDPSVLGRDKRPLVPVALGNQKSTTCKWIRFKSPCFSRSVYYHGEVSDMRYTDGHTGQVYNSMSC